MKVSDQLNLTNPISSNTGFQVPKLFFKSPFEGGLRGMTIGLLILLLVPFKTLHSQNNSDTIQEVAEFTNLQNPENILQVFNINGSVTVEGYNGKEIQITAQKTIEANRKEDVNRGLNEMQLIVEEQADQVLIYLEAPFIQVKKSNGKISYCIDDWDQEYDFKFDINIKLPLKMNLNISTINRGSVAIHNMMARELIASNVNGEIELNEISGTTRATTLNGDIRARYHSSPTDNSKYETINGTIEVFYPEDLAADIRFESMHGDLYTDFQDITRLNTRLEESKDRNNGTTSYRVDQFAPVRIGAGGPEYRFQVLNGDVYIKRIKS
ncbi:DUF4097 family beta strand repeat-containing protein [Aliifodinibius sp. S!AR15-10]|nr:DUF4097 family beta strand repeat-containing protein [Aliifodinibius sp. S!AR15-10]MDR8390526.1 DUF4097 family beta strand repeat-containing protein [Aliifodinibius sp. S!AR15-10]